MVSPKFLENFPLLREINYELFMACLRLIKSMVNHMIKTPTT
jgi:hypothetical protein